MKEPRTELVFESKTNKPLTITNDIVKLARPSAAQWGYIKWIDRENKEIDLSELIEVDNIPLFPEGMECITMACDLTLPVIPVSFEHEGTQYREVFFYAKDLIYVSGNQGHHLNGE